VKSNEELLVVVGGGAAGVYGAIHAKTVAPHLSVVVIEKGKPLSKVCVIMPSCYSISVQCSHSLLFFSLVLSAGESFWRRTMQCD